MTLAQAEEAVAEADVQVLGLIRYEFRLRAPRPGTRIRAGDILVLQADPEGLSNALVTLGMRLEEDVAPPKPEKAEDDAAEPVAADAGEKKEEKPKPAAPAEDSAMVLAELVVTPAAPLIGRSAAEIDMRARYHINLLAIAHEGRRAIGRLRSTRIAASDVLLVQGTPETIAAFAADQGCLPLAERPLRLPDRRQMVLAAGIMIGAVVVASTGLVSTAVAFTAGVLAAMVTKVVPPRAVYGAIDWPVIVLLGCLLPVAGAMQTTGLAERLAALLVEDVASGAPLIALVLILIVTMTLSDVMNNAATVAVMAPIALGTAASLGANPDAFLMAVAIGGSCAFLTPIGHQNNTLILGPGGLRFGDYWRLGLPVEVLVVAVAVPVILLVWGL
jgi:di/tricarboxylate transporter